MASPDALDPVRFHDFEQAGWQRAAAHYPGTFGTLTAQTIAPLLDAAGVCAGVRVLDVATGPGYVAGAARARGASVIGLDFSRAMIEEARGCDPGVAFREGDAEALPFEDGSFDAVVMNFGLLHLARPEVAIAEAYRVLRPGGRYAFTVWDAPERAVGFGMVMRAIETHGTLDVGLPDGPPFFRFSDPDECRRTLRHTGFVDPDVQPLPLVWTLPSAEGLFDAMSRGGVRTTAALRAQTPDALVLIRHALHTAMLAFQQGDTCAVPMPAVLASATKA